MSATNLAAGPRFYFRLPPTESSQDPAVVVVAAMMQLAAEVAGCLQLVALLPPHSVLAAVLVAPNAWGVSIATLLNSSSW